MPSVNAHMLTTGTPDLGADGKDYRANFVHAPFFEKSVRQASPCGCVVRRLPACDIARDMIPRGTAMMLPPIPILPPSKAAKVTAT
jgi:hypothetical protein